jgi:hypothetical protein
MARERYNESRAHCVSTLGNSFWSSSFTTLVLIEHFCCVIVTEHSMSLKRIESYMRTVGEFRKNLTPSKRRV